MHARRPLALLGVVAVIAAGCAGSTGTPSAALPLLTTPSGAPSAAPASTAPSAAPTPAPSAAPASAAPSTAESGAPVPSLDLSGIEANLSHLTSYMEEFTQTGGSDDLDAKVVIVRAPTLQESLDLAGKSSTQRVRVIRSDSYVDIGTGKFVKNGEPASLVQHEFDAFDPGVFLNTFRKAVDFSAVPMLGVQTKNGVQAVHFHADQGTSLGAGKATIPPGAQFDLWVSTDNDYLVALEYSGVPEDNGNVSGSIELTHVNDPTLTVQPPA